MKYKYFLVLALSVLISFVGFSKAFADKPITVSSHSEISVHSGENENENEDDNNATDTEDINDDNGDDGEEATSTDDGLGEEHRSVVSTFVHSLLEVADREGGIGQQVREVAKSQNDSATTTEEAMEKVEDRNKVVKFFFGDDFKNLGVIRSELATTTNNIDKLNLLLNKTTLEADKTVIKNQISALKDVKDKVSAYVMDHENTFSLFGWFTKLFSK